MYTEASSPRQPGDVARLISSGYLPKYTDLCLTFWYHMYGIAIGNLTVTAVDNRNPTLDLFRRSGDQGNIWHQTQVYIQQLSSYYKVN